MKIIEVRNLILYGNKDVNNLSEYWRHLRRYHSIAYFRDRLYRHWFLVVWFALVAILDSATTGIALGMGFTEKNPFQQTIQSYSILLSSMLEVAGYSLVALFLVYTGSIKLGYFLSIAAYTLGPAFTLAGILLTNMGKLVPY